MRQIALALLLLAAPGLAARAENGSQTLQGVFAPPQSAAGSLRGVYTPPPPIPRAPSLPSKVTAPDYGISERGPDVSLPGKVSRGQTLPEGVKPSPIPGRAGYGRAMVNGRPAIIDLGANRIIDYSD
jgi:hypothetical protein